MVKVCYYIYYGADFTFRPTMLGNLVIIFFNLFNSEAYNSYSGRDNLTRYVFSLASIKLLSALAVLFSQVTINVWANQGIGVSTSILLRYNLASVLSAWLPEFLLGALPSMGTAAYYVNI